MLLTNGGDDNRQPQRFGSEMSTASEEPDHLWFTSPGTLTLLDKYSDQDNQVFWP